MDIHVLEKPPEGPGGTEAPVSAGSREGPAGLQALAGLQLQRWSLVWEARPTAVVRGFWGPRSPRPHCGRGRSTQVRCTKMPEAIESTPVSRNNKVDIFLIIVYSLYLD